jgi:lysozyme family protein
MSDSIAFTTAFGITVGFEGGYVDDPNDPGGETKYGISKAAHPTLDIKDLTEAQAKQIYYTDYWMPCRCDVMALSLAIVVFDAAVNNGVSRATHWLQTALGVTADGVIGQHTMTALGKADPETVLQNFHGQRICFMSGLQDWNTYSVGWSRRLAALPYQAATAAASVGAA